MQHLGCGVTYIEPSLEFPAAFPRCAASNWELGDTGTGLTLLPVNKDNQALIDPQVLYLTYWNFFFYYNLRWFGFIPLVSMETASVM